MVIDRLGARGYMDLWQDESFNKEADALIRREVRRLVLVMRGIELDGVEPRDKIERNVLQALTVAESLYGGLDKGGLNVMMDMEIENVKRSKRDSKGI